MSIKNSFSTIFLAVVLIILVTGCQAGSLTLPAASFSADGQAFESSQIVGNISAQELEDVDGASIENVSATVITQGSRANLRSGPGLDFDIVGKGNPGAIFDVLGRSEDGEWWQLCCTTDDVEGFDAGLTVWAASSTLELAGEAEDVPAAEARLNEDLTSLWNVDWECGSERCDISECTATVEASVDEDSTSQWLRVDHRVLWAETCFSTDEWFFEVNRVTGLERSGEQEENFLYRYWVGPFVETANKVFEMPDGKRVAASCTGPFDVEVDEGDGWTTVYTGNTCHDIRTGMLLSLTYEKRWLFTGEFEGETYERAYFNDFEVMEQNLAETNLQLSYLD